MPKEDLIWQDPLPQTAYPPSNGEDIINLKGDRCIRAYEADGFGSGTGCLLSVLCGGANGARLALAPEATGINAAAPRSPVLYYPGTTNSLAGRYYCAGGRGRYRAGGRCGYGTPAIFAPPRMRQDRNRIPRCSPVDCLLSAPSCASGCVSPTTQRRFTMAARARARRARVNVGPRRQMTVLADACPTSSRQRVFTDRPGVAARLLR